MVPSNFSHKAFYLRGSIKDGVSFFQPLSLINMSKGQGGTRVVLST